MKDKALACLKNIMTKFLDAVQPSPRQEVVVREHCRSNGGVAGSGMLLLERPGRWAIRPGMIARRYGSRQLGRKSSVERERSCSPKEKARLLAGLFFYRVFKNLKTMLLLCCHSDALTAQKTPFTDHLIFITP